MEVINQKDQQFPSITICNQNRIMKSKLQKTRFAPIPAIDNAKCGCKLFTAFENEKLEAKRKKRSMEALKLPWWFDFDMHDDDSNALKRCGQNRLNFKVFNTETIKIYHKRFKSELEKFARQYFDDESFRNYIQKVVNNEIYDDPSFYSDFHYDLVGIFRDEHHRHVRSINSTNTTITPSTQFYENSYGVKNESDWYGYMSSLEPSEYDQISDMASITKNETKNLGHKAIDLIQQCVFDQHEVCSYLDFYEFQHKKYGNCFTWNHGIGGDRVRKTSLFGAQNGLKLTLFIEKDEYIGLFSQVEGVRVVIHPPFTVPFPEDHGFDAKPGMATNFGIRVNQVTRLRYPYGSKDCTPLERTNADVFDDKNVYNGKYTFKACSKSCVQNELRSRCHCIDDINTIYALHG